jgi:hypothetical protein
MTFNKMIYYTSKSANPARAYRKGAGGLIFRSELMLYEKQTHHLAVVMIRCSCYPVRQGAGKKPTEGLIRNSPYGFVSTTLLHRLDLTLRRKRQRMGKDLKLIRSIVTPRNELDSGKHRLHLNGFTNNWREKNTSGQSPHNNNQIVVVLKDSPSKLCRYQG